MTTPTPWTKDMERQRDLEEIRAEVFTLLGKTIVNLQSIERMLKIVLRKSEIRGVLGDTPEAIEARSAWVEKSTMGPLTKELLSRAFTTEETDGSKAKKEAPREFRLRSRFIVDEVAMNDLERGFADLVAKRNDLAHHFTTLFDLQTEQGCEAAINHLNQIVPLVRSHHALLGSLVQSTYRSMEEMLLKLSNSFEQSENAAVPTPDDPEKDANTASSS